MKRKQEFSISFNSLWRSFAKILMCEARPRRITGRRIVHGFADLHQFVDSHISSIVSKISSVKEKSITYVQDELLSGLKLTNLGEYK
jgi:hypothetical protein